MTDRADKKTHHHGDLRNALVAAGLELLREGGTAALTLRGCAAKAGVSHAAPKHHFATLAELQTAIAEACFERFDNFMQNAAATGPQNDKARLKSICRGYLDFAIQEPDYFDAIFSLNALRRLKSDFDDAPSGAYLTLRKACAPFVAPGTDPVVVETQVWALIHGYALLLRMGRFSDAEPGSVAIQATGPFDEVMALLENIG